MFEAIILTFVFLLSIAGLCELMHRFWIYFLTPKGKREKSYLLIVADDNTAVQQIRAGLERIRWSGRKHYSALICVDMGVDKNTAEICENIQLNNEDFIFIKK